MAWHLRTDRKYARRGQIARNAMRGLGIELRARARASRRDPGTVTEGQRRGTTEESRTEGRGTRRCRGWDGAAPLGRAAALSPKHASKHDLSNESAARRPSRQIPEGSDSRSGEVVGEQGRAQGSISASVSLGCWRAPSTLSTHSARGG